MKQREQLSELLILGKGEIARCLAQLATLLELPVTVAEPGAQAHDWPVGVAMKEAVFSETPWPLHAGTHAVIARGHEGDAESVAALLNAEAAHVYLIASARRAQGVIEQATPLLHEEASLARLSAPAGMDLGGKGSMEIALSILAEIQLRRYGASGNGASEKGASGKLLRDLREERSQKVSNHTDVTCPGKRL